MTQRMEELVLLIQRFFSTRSLCIMAMCAAVPPKLIHPSLNQKHNACMKEGRCTTPELFIQRIPEQDNETDASVKEFSRSP